MIKYYINFIVSIIIVIQTSPVFAMQLSASLERYKEASLVILNNEKDTLVKDYIDSCIKASYFLNGLEIGDSRLPAAFNNMETERKVALKKPFNSSAQSVRDENAAYNTFLQPYTKTEYVNLIDLQKQLLERKYFKAETAKNANFIEGYVNSHWSLTRADQAGPSTEFNSPTLGISPWEAIFRLEPTLAFNDGAQAAILGAAGLSYTIFPEIKRDREKLIFDETFCSKWVQKTGVRIGVGVGNLDNHAKLLLGAGTQINALGLWGLYKPDGGTFMFGLSASDLSKFKKVVTWFE